MTAAVLAATVLSAPVTPASGQTAPSAREVEQAVERVYRADRYQREFPVPKTTTKPPPERPPIDPGGLSGIGGVAQLLLWGALAAVVVLLLVHLMRHRGMLVGGGDPTVDDAPTGTTGAAQSAAMIGLLGQADELAARGDWTEAIHLLLLASVDNLKRRLGQNVPAALTSRELLAHVSLPDGGRTAFADLVNAVEFSHFGGKPAGRDLYDACRRHYSRLWAAPAPS
jgi:hypothetical protein